MPQIGSRKAGFFVYAVPGRLRVGYHGMVLADSPPKPKWVSPPRDAQLEAQLNESLGLEGSLAAASLVARGLTSAEDADKFLNPSLDDLHEPMLLPDAEKALEAIMLAKERGEKVYVHGDYDVDGVTSTAIWTRALRKLDFEVVPHVPHRMREGYGIHQSAVREAAESGAKLFLTCDCGSGANEMVEMAKEFGMRVVITDHHELGSELPNADALVNPHVPGSRYPFDGLCGAGVAFKIAQAVAEECGAKREQFVRAYLDLVCLGTIADVVPLYGENRILAWHGLKALTSTKKKGVRALIDVADIDLSQRPVNAFDVGWRLGPRLNAAGRIDDAEHSLRLMLTEDEKEARETAKLLNEHNQNRRTEEARILAEAEEIIEEQGLKEKPLIMVAAPEWHIGVVGIVAGRIAERYFRPALVACINEEEGTVKGSARSIPAFQLHEALFANKELFLSCGGHARAAGFSLELDRLDEVTERLTAHAASVLSPEDLVPTFYADAEIHPDEMNFSAFRALEKLEPFGEGNSQVKFIIRGCELTAIKPCGEDGAHIQFQINCKARVQGISFNSSEMFADVSVGDTVDILFEPVVEKWNGQFNCKMRLCTMQKA